MGRHILQQDPRELEDIAAAFLAIVCPIVTGQSRAPVSYQYGSLSDSIHFQQQEDFRVETHILSIFAIDM